MIYGYARVSTHAQAKDGNSLQAQSEMLKQNGAEEIYADAYTGTLKSRPEFDKLMEKMRAGDTLVITKFDRIARNLKQGLEISDQLNNRGIKVDVLNMGMIDDSAMGRLIRNIMLAIAEWERDMIIQRTLEGKQIAKRKPGYHEGRPRKCNETQTNHILELLEANSFTQVAKMTGISRRTVARIKARQKQI